MGEVRVSETFREADGDRTTETCDNQEIYGKKIRGSAVNTHNEGWCSCVILYVGKFRREYIMKTERNIKRLKKIED